MAPVEGNEGATGKGGAKPPADTANTETAPGGAPDPGLVGGPASSNAGPINPALEAAAELIATREQPVGVAGAVELFRQYDEEAHVMWQANGPRKSHIEEIAAVMADVFQDGNRRVYIVQAFASGKFKLYSELREGSPGWPGVTA